MSRVGEVVGVKLIVRSIYKIWSQNSKKKKVISFLRRWVGVSSALSLILNRVVLGGSRDLMALQTRTSGCIFLTQSSRILKWSPSKSLSRGPKITRSNSHLRRFRGRNCSKITSPNNISRRSPRNLNRILHPRPRSTWHISSRHQGVPISSRKHLTLLIRSYRGSRPWAAVSRGSWLRVIP